MTPPSSNRDGRARSWPTGLARGTLLRCPTCGEGRLFQGWFRMHDSCAGCGASFRREQGFYLGSIYINYGVTVLVTGGLYAVLVLALGCSQETALTSCLVAAVILPVLFFRHARSFLLALDGSVNRHQQVSDGQPADRRLTSLVEDDGRAGCAMGVALVLILLFGLAMAAVTILFAMRDAAGSARRADEVDLR